MPEPSAIFDALLRVDLTPMALAILVGGMIGAEREVHGRPAGFRTHIMVCLASTLLIRASHQPPELGSAAPEAIKLVWDPNRLGAGVVTGIGFLGAAAVIRSGDIVRGITTGACVWAVAVLGVVIGSGAYAVAFVGALVMLGVLVIFDHALAWTSPLVYRRMTVRFEGRTLSGLRDELVELLRENRIVIQDISGRRGAEPGPMELDVRLRCRSLLQTPELLDRIAALEGVREAEWRMLHE